MSRFNGKQLQKLIDKGMHVTDEAGNIIDNVDDLPSRGNKLNAERTTIDGITFDSLKESRRYSELKMLMKSKDKSLAVKKFDMQVPFPIYINDILCFTYLLDFQIEYENGRIEYEDVKGHKEGCTYALFRLKKKCVEAFYSIQIKEV